MTPLLALLLVLPASAQVDWKADPMEDFRIILRDPDLPAPPRPEGGPVGTLSVPEPAIPLHCRPEVIELFKTLWRMAGSGREEYEAAAAIDPGPQDTLLFRYAPMTREPLRQTVTVTRGVTLAIAHTHPDASNPRAGPRDNDSPVPNYIISRRALYVTAPGTRRESFVRADWSRPCR